MTDFQKRIWDICDSYGGQAAFARKSGLHHGQVCKWCNGKAMPNSAALITMAKFCGLSVDYILGLTDKPQREDNAWQGCLLHGQV